MFFPSDIWLLCPAHEAGVRAALRAGPRAGWADDVSAVRARRSGSVAVLPILGVLTQRPTWLTVLMGGSSTEAIGREFDRLMADASVEAIALEIDSPGGTSGGIPELAAKIFSARGRKPVVAVASFEATSGAYWIAAAADEVVASPSAALGSIGALALHEDRSGRNAKDGLKFTYVTSSPKKTFFNPDNPLSAEARAELQRRVDEAGAIMVLGIARYRSVSPAIVREKYGQGRVVSAARALEAGMINRIETLEETIRRLAGSGSARSSAPSGSGSGFGAMSMSARRAQLAGWKREMAETERRLAADTPGRLPGIMLAGIAVSFGCPVRLPSGEYESFAPGSFSRCLAAGTNIRALWGHDENALLGQTRDGSLRCWETAKDLRFELRPPDTRLGRAMVQAVRSGDIRGVSIGGSLHDVRPYRYCRMPAYEVLRAELTTIGLTARPMLGGTTAVRAYSLDRVET